jgi:hypothetical protein
MRGSGKLLGNQKIHCHIPASKKTSSEKVFSKANVFNTTHIVHLQDEEYQVKDIRGSVTCEYDRKWWLACVLQVNDSEI